jgi:hypothetical protein
MSNKREQPDRTDRELLFLTKVRGDMTDEELEALAVEACAAALRALAAEREPERPGRGPKRRRQR